MVNEPERDWAKEAERLLPCAAPDITDITEICGTVSATDGQIEYGHNRRYCPAFYREQVAAALRKAAEPQAAVELKAVAKEIAEKIGYFEKSQPEQFEEQVREVIAILNRHFRADDSRAWQPIEVEPTDRFLLLCGKSDDGIIWRDVGVYQGTDEAGRHFVDKYGAGSHPTHWQPLPAAPEGKK